jgi:hypothetical protein
MKELEFTQEFTGNTLGPVSVDNAIQRLVAFGSSSRSGFLGYDLAGHVARLNGQLNHVGPWTILLADALGGQVTVDNVRQFAQHLTEFTDLINSVPDEDLASLDATEFRSVVEFCTLGFPGAWALKITKVGALLRSKTIPILDGHLARAFGYARDRFSAGRQPRWEAIEHVVSAIASGIKRQSNLLGEIRHRAEESVPAINVLSDVRLVDIIIWTSQDDRMERRGKPRDMWLRPPTENPPTLDEVSWLRQQPAPRTKDRPRNVTSLDAPAEPLRPDL